MEQIGRVIEINGDTARVIVRRHDVCGKCGGCGVAISGRGENYIDAQNIANASLGQTVKISTSTGHVLKASFILYIVPILALMLGIWLGEQGATYYGLMVSEQLVGFAVGVFFLIGSFLLIHSYDRRISTEQMKSMVIEIISEDTEAKPKDELC